MGKSFFWRYKIRKEQSINEKIKADKVQLIGAKGEKLGVTPLVDAIKIGEGQGLDVVCVPDTTNPVVCKLMDYGKYRFEQQKREKEAKKKTKQTEMKEIRVSTTIGDHDLEYRIKNARNFIQSDNKVKVTLKFRGREIVKNELGKAVLERFAEELSDIADLEKAPKMEGRSMFLILAKKK